MEFSRWYSKSITEAQERYKKEDKRAKEQERMEQENVQVHADLYDSNYGSVEVITASDDEDLLRLADGGATYLATAKGGEVVIEGCFSDNDTNTNLSEDDDGGYQGL